MSATFKFSITKQQDGLVEQVVKERNDGTCHPNNQSQRRKAKTLVYDTSIETLFLSLRYFFLEPILYVETTHTNNKILKIYMKFQPNNLQFHVNENFDVFSIKNEFKNLFFCQK